MAKISVVIPTYNRSDAFQRTIAVMENSNRKPDEIIVVDQTKDEVLATKIKDTCANSGLKIYYFHESEPSLTKARNVGLTKVTGDIVVFMDDDVDVKDNTFGLVEEIFSDTKVALLGGFNKTTDSNQTFKGTLFGKSSFFKWHKGHVTKAVYGMFPKHCETQVETEWAMGFFFAIRKRYVDEWNLTFDENLKYYAYNEDMDFTYRFYLLSKNAGMKCLYDSRIVVDHRVSSEFRIPTRKATFMVCVHRRYLSNKLFGSLNSKLWTIWCDMGDMIFAFIRGRYEHACDIWKAMMFCCKYRNDIKVGNLHYDLFM